MRQVLLLSGVLAAGLVVACCTPQRQSASPTASEDALTDAERAKIDDDLLRLVADSVQITDVPSTRRPDGTQAYAVRIRASDLEALRNAGVQPDSTANGMAWAWLTLTEIRGVARLDGVTAIQADNDPVPREDPSRQ